MHMKTMKIILVGLLFLSTQYAAHAQLRTVQNKLEKARLTYDSYLGTGDIVMLKKYNNELRQFLDKLRGNEEAGSAYLQAMIHQKKLEILTEKHEIEQPENRGLNGLNNAIKQARVLLLKHQPRRLQSICAEIGRGSNPLRLDCEGFKATLQQLEQRVKRAEFYIYDFVVKGPTVAQLEQYLLKYDYEKVSGKAIRSSQGIKALEALFDLYTLDGHNSTISRFHTYISMRFPKEHLDFLLPSLKERPIYTRRMALASEGERLLKQGLDEANLTSYRNFIKRAAPTGMAFTALQQLIAYYQGDPTSQLNLFEELKPSFCSKESLISSSCKRFNDFQSIVSQAQTSSRYELVDIMGDVDKYYPRHQVKLHFSRNDQYFTLLPIQGFSQIHQFSLDGSQSSLVATAEERTQSNINYRFSNNAIDPEAKILREEQKLYFRGAACIDSFNNDYLLNSDFFVDETRGIALFVSKSAYQRGRVDPTTKEYNSIWAIDPNSKFQENQGAYYFNGKYRGNANTDIYYSLKNPDSDTWSCPIHLGPLVNTRYSERSPILIDNTLYFASEGHSGLGGFDIFSVTIFKEGNQLKVSQLKNETAFNSSADELFYQRAFINGQNRPSHFISTNRSDEEGYYKVYQLTKTGTNPPPTRPNVTKQPKRTDPPSGTGGFPVPSKYVLKSKLDLKLQCYVKSNPIPDRGRGKIQLEGTVNVPTDDPNTVMRLDNATIKLTWPGMRSDDPLVFTTDSYGIFNTQVPIRDDKDLTIPHWNIVIHKSYNNSIVNFKAQVEKLDQLCGNANYAYQDYIAEEIDRIDKLEIPYFFEFDDYEVDNPLNGTILGKLGKYSQIYEQYARTFSNDNSNRRFIVVAYADTLGTTNDNKWLSGKRADDVREQLIEWGIPAHKISTFAFGETTKFSHQIDSLPVLFPTKITGPAVFTRRQKIIHQLNRRAEIIFCSSKYRTDRECLEYHGLWR